MNKMKQTLYESIMKEIASTIKQQLLVETISVSELIDVNEIANKLSSLTNLRYKSIIENDNVVRFESTEENQRKYNYVIRYCVYDDPKYSQYSTYVEINRYCKDDKEDFVYVNFDLLKEQYIDNETESYKSIDDLTLDFCIIINLFKK